MIYLYLHLLIYFGIVTAADVSEGFIHFWYLLKSSFSIVIEIHITFMVTGNLVSLIHLICTLWEETGVPGVNPHREKKRGAKESVTSICETKEYNT